ncbi:hypothetical protein CMEL01_07534 [Colletotrichum melonis]|uniref:Uncharacterized protein n=1 Tax=Colletotrichum melonis TaxID=1209925 RepID=A0AAI9XI00_9PEZI|nr:hypothetical protein CMEL01_07534 [Colletotrichum melonis]
MFSRPEYDNFERGGPSTSANPLGRAETCNRRTAFREAEVPRQEPGLSFLERNTESDATKALQRQLAFQFGMLYFVPAAPQVPQDEQMRENHAKAKAEYVKHHQREPSPPTASPPVNEEAPATSKGKERMKEERTSEERVREWQSNMESASTGDKDSRRAQSGRSDELSSVSLTDSSLDSSYDEDPRDFLIPPTLPHVAKWPRASPSYKVPRPFAHPHTRDGRQRLSLHRQRSWRHQSFPEPTYEGRDRPEMGEAPSNPPMSTPYHLPQQPKAENPLGSYDISEAMNDHLPRQSKTENQPKVNVDPQNPQDITIHTELVATIDLEEELEDYSRLVRLGRFKAAQKFFTYKLLGFIENAYVLDHYCEGLSAMPDFHKLSQIGETFVPRPQCGVVQAHTYMLLSKADFVGGVNSMETLAQVRLYRADTKKIQMLVGGLSPKENVAKFHANEIAEVYLHLRAEGRIWEFGDLLQVLLRGSREPACQVLEVLLRCDLGDGKDRLIKLIKAVEEDWSVAEINEETSFALLEIFTTIVLDSMCHSENTGLVNTIFGFSQKKALEVLQLNPTNSKSRPYLRWIISKVLLEQYSDPRITGFFSLKQCLHNFPGHRIAPNLSDLPKLCMISYAPDEDEAPRWSPDPATTVGHDEVLRTVLGVAEELGDVWMQATCLQLLIYQSPEPRTLLQSLDDLWRSAGTHQRHLETRLYRYIPEALRTTEDRDGLQRQILLSAKASSQGLKPYAEYMILRALTTRQEEKDSYLERAMDALNSSFQGYVPQSHTQIPTENPSVRKTTSHNWTNGNISESPSGPWQNLPSGPSGGANYVGAQYPHMGYGPAHGNTYVAGIDPFRAMRTTGNPDYIGFPANAPYVTSNDRFGWTGGAQHGSFGQYQTTFGIPYAQNQFPHHQPPPPPPPAPPPPSPLPTKIPAPGPKFDRGRQHPSRPGTETKLNNGGPPEQANNQAGSNNRNHNEPADTSSSD